MTCPTKDMIGVCPLCKEWTDLCSPCCNRGVEDQQNCKTSDDCECAAILADKRQAAIDDKIDELRGK